MEGLVVVGIFDGAVVGAMEGLTVVGACDRAVVGIVVGDNVVGESVGLLVGAHVEGGEDGSAVDGASVDGVLVDGLMVDESDAAAVMHALLICPVYAAWQQPNGVA